MEKAKKAEVVEDLNGVFAKAGSVVVAHYIGMTVADMADLRSRMRANGSAPPQKLLPAGMMSPVQRSAGSHTSNFTSEFAARVEATTRQKAGSSAKGCAAAAPAAPGGVNAPARTACADVTVVFGIATVASRSHGDDAERSCASAEAGESRAATAAGTTSAAVEIT